MSDNPSSIIQRLRPNNEQVAGKQHRFHFAKDEKRRKKNKNKNKKNFKLTQHFISCQHL